MKITKTKQSTHNLIEAVVKKNLLEAEKEEETEVEETTENEDNKEVASDYIDSILSKNTDVEELPFETEQTDVAPIDMQTPSVETNTEMDFPAKDTESKDALNNIVNGLWGLIGEIQGTQFILKADNVENIDSIDKLLEDIITDLTIDIGMVYKILELANPKLAMLLNKGQNKASEKLLNTETTNNNEAE